MTSRRLGKIIAVAAITLTSTFSLSTSASAVDYGDWVVGCGDGRACFWGGAYKTWPVVAATRRDSNFEDDRQSDGGTLDNRVEIFENLMSIYVQAYASPNYQNKLGPCMLPGTRYGSMPRYTVGGQSSFKRCYTPGQ
jgi:hypothetical protein